MVPDSPFIKMLNNPANIIESPLTVISGNCTIHPELKALLVILTKLYFRRKNDMVVDTWSMYFGTPRKKEIWFFLDDAKDHFVGDEITTIHEGLGSQSHGRAFAERSTQGFACGEDWNVKRRGEPRRLSAFPRSGLAEEDDNHVRAGSSE